MTASAGLGWLFQGETIKFLPQGVRKNHWDDKLEKSCNATNAECQAVSSDESKASDLH